MRLAWRYSRLLYSSEKALNILLEPQHRNVRIDIVCQSDEVHKVDDEQSALRGLKKNFFPSQTEVCGFVE